MGDFAQHLAAPHDADEIGARIRRLLRDLLFLEPGDADLIDTGLIDSVGLMKLFAALEEEFCIKIGYDDLSLNHFRTAGAITAFVVLKRDPG